MTNKFYDINEVKQAAQGKWLSILFAVTPCLHNAIKKAGRHVACPVHGGKDGFRLFKDAAKTGGGVCNSCGTYADGFELIQWIQGCTFGQALSSVAEHLNVDPKNTQHNKRDIVSSKTFKGNPVCSTDNTKKVTAISTVTPKTEQNSVPNWVREKEASLNDISSNKGSSDSILSVWEQSVRLSDAPECALAYLRARKVLSAALLAESTDSIRFCAELPYYEEVEDENGKTSIKKTKYPALICAIRDQNNEIVTLHRTYLAPKGGKKADVESPRKMMSVPEGKTISNSAIKLGYPIDGVLGVAEGLETALSAYHASRIPTWSTINAGLMEQFTAPDIVHTVLIWADKDKNGRGESAAAILSAKLKSQGIRVFILTPNDLIPRNKKGVDWNDVLLNRGLDGFPRAAYLIEFLSINSKRYA